MRRFVDALIRFLVGLACSYRERQQNERVTLVTLKCFNILSCYIFIWLFDQRQGKKQQQQQQHQEAEELCICNNAFYGDTKPHIRTNHHSMRYACLLQANAIFFHQINFFPSYSVSLIHILSLSLSQNRQHIQLYMDYESK